MGQAVADGDRVLVGHGFPNLGGNWVTEAVDAATGAPLAEVGAGLVDGLRGSTLLTRRQGFDTGTPVAISLTVTDLDQPGSGWSGTIGVVAALGASPSRRHSPLARTSPSSLATGLCSSLVVH